MKKIIYITLLIWLQSVNAQILKFSTFYASFSTAAPFAENQMFLVDGVAGSGQLVEITQENKPNLNISLGLRKIARFDYQVKQGRFYNGNENEVSDYATISNAPGLEYLFEYSRLRNRNMEFEQHEYKVRYISNNYTIKSAYVEDGLINLKYTLGEFRYRKNLGNLDFTFGFAHRSHPVYGYSPIEAWFAIPQNKHWWQLAYEFGYSDNENQVWTYQGQTIAQSDSEFYKYHFGRAVNQYNRIKLNELGLQQELSIVLGYDYYYYKENVWLHTWGSAYPIHKGLSEFSYTYPSKKLEWDLGLIFGVKINRHLGAFVEARHLKYWDIESYDLKTGINYLIF